MAMRHEAWGMRVLMRSSDTNVSSPQRCNGSTGSLGQQFCPSRVTGQCRKWPDPVTYLYCQLSPCMSLKFIVQLCNIIQHFQCNTVLEHIQNFTNQRSTYAYTQAVVSLTIPPQLEIQSAELGHWIKVDRVGSDHVFRWPGSISALPLRSITS